MSWPTGEVCRMSGVTSRTLRHYHHVGLLVPESTGPGGLRRYGRRELRRLQRILVMRELGLGLADIRRILDAESDEAAALRRHLHGLESERDRLSVLVETVRRTVDALEGDDMTSRPEELFAGFDTAHYAERARTHWPQQWERARAAGEGMTPQEDERMRAEAAEQMARMAAHLRAGTPADAPAVQAEVEDHHRRIRRMWTPDADAFANLARVYAEDGPWREVYERVAPGLADYQREAMEVYAERSLRGAGT
ncbi:MerR family transcriptional regulator [Nocardiopsis terrae]|uniref:DNA-binding transcriptional MerR regulator n=1 Tax=Nocardiopsis terrae TaxID=372655 RepID=A0ABR9HIA4_9ACTN|nr:MerR family transcriptional regulator [Nocardiopsis terrae]MBE1458738.1 DNA-binding transcriptional MerR regulator [Nocardiopsis terrae]GHC78763.1 MerR family transcriptional regulator [Nocardiopsis terrae]